MTRILASFQSPVRLLNSAAHEQRGCTVDLNQGEITMAVEKVMHTFEVRDYHLKFLNNMMEQYKIQNEGKALRILLDYAVGDAELGTVFDRKNARCYGCH
jgi:3-isopropylmalate dehydratase small subunit